MGKKGKNLPYPRIKTDVVIAVSTLFFTPKSLATCAAAGAIIEEETGVTNVKEETTMVAAHFWRYGQLDYVVGSLPI